MKRFADRTHDDFLLWVYALLMLGGLVMIYSASSVLAESRYGSNWHFMKSQLIWVGVSIGVFLWISRIDLRRWSVYSVPALFVTLLMLIAVFFMPARNEAQRWLMIGPFSVQPAEFFKFLLVIYLAFSLAQPHRDVSRPRGLLLPYAPLIGIGLLLVFEQPALGSVIVTLLTVLGVFFLAGVRWKHLLVATVPAMVMGYVTVFIFGYKKSRVDHFLASATDPLSSDIHQVKQAAIALGNGGITGEGIGQGIAKLFFLPYPHTDFVFASMGEEIGLIGMLVVLVAFVLLLWRGMSIALRQPDRFGFLLAAGMTWMLFVSIAINVGMVTAMLPVIGIALPFFSYGGSSLLVSSSAVAILYNLSARSER